MGALNRLFPDTLMSTWYLRYYGLTKIPLLFYARPSVVEKSDERVELPLQAIATVPSESDQPAARFRLTLSLKRSYS